MQAFEGFVFTTCNNARLFRDLDLALHLRRCRGLCLEVAASLASYFVSVVYEANSGPVKAERNCVAAYGKRCEHSNPLVVPLVRFHFPGLILSSLEEQLPPHFFAYDSFRSPHVLPVFLSREEHFNLDEKFSAFQVTCAPVSRRRGHLLLGRQASQASQASPPPRRDLREKEQMVTLVSRLRSPKSAGVRLFRARFFFFVR